MQFFGGSLVADVSPSPAAPPGTATGLSGNNANMLYIFNRSGVCLLYREWYRPHRTLDAKEDQKLMFGLLFYLRSFTAKMDPTSGDKGNLGAPLLPGQGCSFYSFRTNTYKLSFMESPSGDKLRPHLSAFLENLRMFVAQAATLMWLRNGGNAGYQSLNFQGVSVPPWMQARTDIAILGLQPDMCQAITAGGHLETRTMDPTKHLPELMLQF